MTTPIKTLEEKLNEIVLVEKICKDNQNFKDLGEVQRQKQMYIQSINSIKQTLKL